MRLKKISIAGILLLLAVSLRTATAQPAVEEKPMLKDQLSILEQSDTIGRREDAVRVFIDCEHCDMNYIRDEIPYVNYVRDVKEAQVYILETSERTGSGGRKYTFAFVGQQDYRGISDTLNYSSRPDDSRDLRRVWRTQMLKMGLMPYVARSPLYTEVMITASERVERQEVEDRWNNWVFELESEPSFEGEESLKELSIRNSVSAVKITHDWKLDFDFDHFFERTKYTFDDTVYTNDRSFERLDVLVVKSLGEHWSAGLRTDLSSSSFRNTRLDFQLLPSLEYNLFPYARSTHRQLRFLYGIGGSFNRYIDTTIFNRIEEQLWLHQLQIAYQVQEKWGSVNVALEGSHYFHDFTKNRVEVNGYISVRIVKGLSLRVGGAAARVNDQLSLVRGELTEADILLQLLELETAYNLEGEIGLTYTFGSIYNNVVNPRFGNGRRWF